MIRYERHIWNFRNEVQSVVSAEAKEIRDERKRREKIRTVLERGVAGLRTKDQYMILDVDFDTLVDLPAEEQDAWLGQVEAARKRFLAIEQKAMKRMKTTFESYMEVTHTGSNGDQQVTENQHTELTA